MLSRTFLRLPGAVRTAKLLKLDTFAIFSFGNGQQLNIGLHRIVVLLLRVEWRDGRLDIGAGIQVHFVENGCIFVSICVGV